ncbi:MAG: 3-hydroxyacyl-CoA dehydrogenase family protein, partial [Acidobacteria bacterium]|nr:3-hydroxyacyl-CoA dehydrogenase family protein [Acidobacteriota bacterium]
MDINEAVVIGTGAMGPGIAAILALGGARTTIVSRTATGAMRAVFTAQALLRQLEENGLAAAESVNQAVPRLFGADDVAAPAAAAGLVVESILEDMALKKALFARLDRAAPPETILASNTSGLSITEIAKAAGRPNRVLTAHFWNPPHLMPL